MSNFAQTFFTWKKKLHTARILKWINFILIYYLSYSSFNDHGLYIFIIFFEKHWRNINFREL